MTSADLRYEGLADPRPLLARPGEHPRNEVPASAGRRP